MNYPHLIETTMLGHAYRTFMLGPGYTKEMLTDEERKILDFSEEYIKEYEVERTEKLLKWARMDFEKLRDIDGMPEEAIYILKKWTTRDGDYEDDY